MNRHARRAAAARSRGRQGYWGRLVRARTNGALPLAGVHFVNVEHGRDCALFDGARTCTCVPDITVSGPNGIVVIDENGIGRKMVKQ
jgi:hypothetical protein